MSDLSAQVLDPEQLRGDFPILGSEVHDGLPLVYLDNAASTQRPRQVTTAIRRIDETCYANVHRGIHLFSEQTTEAYEQSRETVAGLIDARQSSEILFASGTTAGINLVARSWGDAEISAGDEILLTVMEHHSNIIPWQQLAERTGARIRWVDIDDRGRLEMDSLREQLNERTRLLAVTAVSNVLGTINPLGEIVDLAHQHGALVLVDGAQAVPHMRFSVDQLDVDFLAFSGHKMLGPTGVGVLYAKASILEKMPAFQGGGGMIHRVTQDGFEASGVPARFEAGTPPISQVLGLSAAIEYLQGIGLEAIHRHEQKLAEAARQQLAAIEKLHLLGPGGAESAGVVGFMVEGIHPHDLAQALDSQGVAIRAGHHCAMPLHDRLELAASCRASFYLYNTLQEVEILATAVERACTVFGG
ncbi:MAG: SufS family cysteine desulfurase, partial [Pirellulaceae bacterium]|nr:SufS family cysteine desulfurase [Pirellulaceae bacterium]